MNNKIIYFLIFVLILFKNNQVSAQSANIPYNPEYYHLIDRYEIKQKDFGNIYTNIKPYNRKDIASFVENFDSTYQGTLSEADKYNLAYLMLDNWEHMSDTTIAQVKKPFLKYFYRSKIDILNVHEKDFDLHVNPVFLFSAGQDNQTTSMPYINQRGGVIHGSIAGKVGFYLQASDILERYPYYVQQYSDSHNGTLPGQQWYKNTDNGSKEYFNAQGYINFQLLKDYISAEFGRGRNFMGNGYRSLFLSDFANDYTYLKLNTRIWHLEYTNLYTQMNTINGYSSQGALPNKYMTMHHLGWNVTKNFNIGIFEQVIFNRTDSLGNNHFDISYLNPLIFYRSLEHGLGDADNVQLGFDFKYNFIGRWQVYGQLMIDDMSVSNFGTGFYGNKFAYQLGAKYIDAFGVSNLDLQGEVNVVDPYTYSHKNTAASNLPDGQLYTNQSHYYQELAHPNGANFYELIGILRYRPDFFPKISIVAKGIFREQGLNEVDENGNVVVNYGNDIFLDYNTAPGAPDAYGVELLQGTKMKTIFMDATITYSPFHNVFVDLRGTLRNTISDDDRYTQYENYFGAAVRWNIGQRYYDF